MAVGLNFGYPGSHAKWAGIAWPSSHASGIDRYHLCPSQHPKVHGVFRCRVSNDASHKVQLLLDRLLSVCRCLGDVTLVVSEFRGSRRKQPPIRSKRLKKDTFSESFQKNQPMNSLNIFSQTKRLFPEPKWPKWGCLCLKICTLFHGWRPNSPFHQDHSHYSMEWSGDIPCWLPQDLPWFSGEMTMLSMAKNRRLGPGGCRKCPPGTAPVRPGQRHAAWRLCGKCPSWNPWHRQKNVENLEMVSEIYGDLWWF